MNEKKVLAYFCAPQGTPIVRDIEAAQALAQPGDVGLSIGSGVSGALFRLVYKVPYTHTFVVCVPDNRIAEALPGGFVQGPFARYHKSKFALMRWKGATREQQLAMGNLARERSSFKEEGKAQKGYDWGELFWLIIRGIVIAAGDLFGRRRDKKRSAIAKALAWAMGRKNLLDSKGRVICSGEAEDIAEAVGLGLDTKDGFVAPGHFATSGKLKFVCIHNP